MNGTVYLSDSNTASSNILFNLHAPATTVKPTVQYLWIHSNTHIQTPISCYFCRHFNLHRYTVKSQKTKIPEETLHNDSLALLVLIHTTNHCRHLIVEGGCMRSSLLLKRPGTTCPNKMNGSLYFHTSSTNGVLTRFPLAAMVFLPSTNFFAACKERTHTVISSVLEVWETKKWSFCDYMFVFVSLITNY